MIDPFLLTVLICPKCKSDQLTLNDEETRIICNSCWQFYRIEDDIPIMIVESGQVVPEEHRHDIK